MTTFTHKNTEITLSERGDFTATVSGKFVRASSLDAMKKRIDKAAEETFEPFYALRDRSHRDGKDAPDLVRIKIVRKEKPGRSRWDKGGFVDEAGQVYQSRSLLPDTQDARSAHAAHKEARRLEDEAEKARREKYDTLEALFIIH